MMLHQHGHGVRNGGRNVSTHAVLNHDTRDQANLKQCPSACMFAFKRPKQTWIRNQRGAPGLWKSRQFREVEGNRARGYVKHASPRRLARVSNFREFPAKDHFPNKTKEHSKETHLYFSPIFSIRAYGNYRTTDTHGREVFTYTCKHINLELLGWHARGCEKRERGLTHGTYMY